MSDLAEHHRRKFRKLTQARAATDAVSLTSNAVGFINDPRAQALSGAGSVASAMLATEVPELEREVLALERDIQSQKVKVRTKQNLVKNYANQLDDIGKQISKQGCPAIYRY
ncbi:hypothetical protein [Maritalea sp.]|uniref:hypothetical protein n=1 Tax=Maritalea sp. TaxID=2003361 RepID=UPI003EF55867